MIWRSYIMYSNAKSGIRKLYKAELMELISVVLVVIGSVIAIVPFVGTLVGGLIVVIAAIIAMISAILGLLALNKAGKDEAAFATAFKIIIIQLILTFVVGIFTAIFKNNPLLGSITELIKQIVDIVVTYFVLTGLRRIFDSLGKSEMAAKSDKVWKIYALSIILSSVCGCLGDSKLGAIKVLAVILSLVSLVASIVAYFKYLGFLKKSANEM